MLEPAKNNLFFELIKSTVFFFLFLIKKNKNNNKEKTK